VRSKLIYKQSSSTRRGSLRNTAQQPIFDNSSHRFNTATVPGEEEPEPPPDFKLEAWLMSATRPLNSFVLVRAVTLRLLFLMGLTGTCPAPCPGEREGGENSPEKEDDREGKPLSEPGPRPSLRDRDGSRREDSGGGFMGDKKGRKPSPSRCLCPLGVRRSGVGDFSERAKQRR
jgi:hypothetical protein